MKKLFKPLPDAVRKNVVLHMRVSAGDFEIITAAAKARNLSVCDYIRRAALGRRTDIRYESKMVLALAAVVEAFQVLHTAVVEQGFLPINHEWDPVIDEAVATMQRISK